MKMTLVILICNFGKYGWNIEGVQNIDVEFTAIDDKGDPQPVTKDKEDVVRRTTMDTIHSFPFYHSGWHGLGLGRQSFSALFVMCLDLV